MKAWNKKKKPKFTTKAKWHKMKFPGKIELYVQRTLSMKNCIKNIMYQNFKTGNFCRIKCFIVKCLAVNTMN